MALTIVASGTASVQAVAQNGSRQGLVLENSDANRCHILVGPGTASATNMSFSLAQNENASLPHCREQLNVMWAGDGSGSLFVTEY